MSNKDAIDYVSNQICLWELAGKLSWNPIKFLACDEKIKRDYLIRTQVELALRDANHSHIHYEFGYIFACVVSNLNMSGCLKILRNEDLQTYWNDKVVL